jgi:hypothetical protein
MKNLPNPMKKGLFQEVGILYAQVFQKSTYI